MLFLQVGDKVLFTKFNNIYPECSFLIEDQPQLYPLICLVSNCHRNANCMEKLAKRVNMVFEAFPKAELLILYFKYRDRPQSIRAGVFWKDFREPRYITMNPFAWERFKSKGEVYEWEFPDILK